MTTMKVSLSSEEKHYLDTVAVGLWSGGVQKPKDVNTLNANELLGKATFCISDKRYDLAERLLTLAEITANNIIDLHFVFNTWIELTYKQRENPHYLNLCIEYCEKDIEIFQEFRAAYLKQYPTHDRVLDIRLPSFKQLTIVYEKQGNIDEAIKLCELAISYNLKDSTKGGYKGRLEKLLKKQNKINGGTL